MRQLGGSTWVLEGPTNIGFIENNGGVTLIDSGNDKDAGRRINKIIREKDWSLTAVINTHSNADHIGGNDYLQRNLNCDICAPALEQAFIEHPMLETAFLWGGFEVKDLRNKFFQAKPSKVTRVIGEGDELEDGSRVISLKGHFMNMIGVKTPDNVLFLADCIFGKNILQKYGVPFIYDVNEYKNTLRAIKEIDAAYYVPSHGEVEEDIKPLADFNLKLVEDVENELVKMLGVEMGFDAILKGVCDVLGISLNAGQYALVGSTIRSFLSYLYDEGRIGFSFRENLMLWKSAAAL